MKFNKKGIAIPVVLAFLVLSTMLFLGLQTMSTREKKVDYSESIKLKNEFLAKGFMNIILLKIMKLPMEFRDAYAWYNKKANKNTIEYLQNEEKDSFEDKAYLLKFMKPFNFIDSSSFSLTGAITGTSAFDFKTSDEDVFSNTFQCTIMMESDPTKTRDDVLVIQTKSGMMYLDKMRSYNDDGSVSVNNERRITSSQTKKIKLNWYQTN